MHCLQVPAPYDECKLQTCINKDLKQKYTCSFQTPFSSCCLVTTMYSEFPEICVVCDCSLNLSDHCISHLSQVVPFEPVVKQLL